jgi:hypothetical protein
MLSEEKEKYKARNEEQERLLALRVLNKHFAALPKHLHLEDEQLKTVINAMIE